MQVRSLIVAVCGVAFFISLPAAAQPEPSVPSLSADQVSRLNAGEVIVAVIEGDVPIGDAIGVVNTPPDQVLAVIRDYERHSEIMEDVSESEVIGTEGEYQIQRGVTDTPWPMDDRYYTLRAWGGPIEVDGVSCLISTWDYVPDSGNLVDTKGYWLLIPWGDDGSQTLLRYHITVDLGTWLPDFLLNWSTENMLPEKINAIRRALGGV